MEILDLSPLRGRIVRVINVLALDDITLFMLIIFESG